MAEENENIRTKVWCEKHQTTHLCSKDHGPDGHGGSSNCCPPSRWSKRQRKMAYKASCLHVLSSESECWDIPESAGELFDIGHEEALAVHEEIAQQLFDWAVRLTPGDDRA